MLSSGEVLSTQHLSKYLVIKNIGWQVKRLV